MMGEKTLLNGSGREGCVSELQWGKIRGFDKNTRNIGYHQKSVERGI